MQIHKLLIPVPPDFIQPSRRFIKKGELMHFEEEVSEKEGIFFFFNLPSSP